MGMYDDWRRDRLIAELGIWGQCEEFPRCDWAYEVGNNGTQLGYWDWVITNRVPRPARRVDRPEWKATEDEVRQVINAASNDVLTAAGNPEAGITDAINLLVNVMLHRLFDDVDATLDEVVTASYSDDVTLNDVVGWMSE